MQSAGDSDTQAATAQNKVLVEKMRNAGINAVFVVGSYIPAADFATDGFTPNLWASDPDSLAAFAFTNDLRKFATAETIGSQTEEKIYNSKPMKKCRAIYQKASGVKVLTPAGENKKGKSTGFVALTNSCGILDVFVAAAKAAGPTLNNTTFAKGLTSVRTIDLPRGKGSFGPGKSDAQDVFTLFKINPNYEPGGSETTFVPASKSFTLR